MRYSAFFAVLSLGLVLAGAGCTAQPTQSTGSNVFDPQIAMSPDMLVLEESWGAFKIGALENDPLLMQMLVLPIMNEAELESIVPAVMARHEEIDWQLSKFYDGGNSVVLVDKDGRDIGTWVKDKEDWFLKAPFWHSTVINP